jgi:cytochrome c nitrite reductase small subunit
MNFHTMLSVLLGLAVGSVVGLGSYTFIYAKGASYFTDDPAACANCHIMDEHYDGWIKASHRAVAVCNDCHTPPGLVAKYLTKATNGFWHSFGFTTGWFPEPLRITPRNRAIAEQACRSCHRSLIEAIAGPHQQDGGLACIRCHHRVGHM